MDGVILWIANLVGNNALATTIMSVIPLIELKGGIIFARSFFGFFAALGLAYLGSTLVFFPVYFLLKPILNGLKKTKFFNKVAIKLENFFTKRASKAKVKAKESNKKAKSEKLLKQLSVFIFVAIPLPMTGVWTGTAIAVFLGLSFKDAILPVVLGNLVAGTIISLLAQLFISIWSIKILDYVLWTLFAIAVIVLVITIINLFKNKKKREEK